MLEYTGTLQQLVDDFGFVKRFSQITGEFIKVMRYLEIGDSKIHFDITEDNRELTYGYYITSSDDYGSIGKVYSELMFDLTMAGLIQKVEENGEINA